MVASHSCSCLNKVSVDLSRIPIGTKNREHVLTTKRYKYATVFVFVDQFSGVSYAYLQKSADADETILPKRAFEEIAKQHGAKINTYHADKVNLNGLMNGRSRASDLPSRESAHHAKMGRPGDG